jgi:hypothetical protein
VITQENSPAYHTDLHTIVPLFEKVMDVSRGGGFAWCQMRVVDPGICSLRGGIQGIVSGVDIISRSVTVVVVVVVAATGYIVQVKRIIFSQINRRHTSLGPLGLLRSPSGSIGVTIA